MSDIRWAAILAVMYILIACTVVIGRGNTADKSIDQNTEVVIGSKKDVTD